MPRQATGSRRTSAQALNDHPPSYETTLATSSDGNRPILPNPQANCQQIDNDDDYHGVCDTLFNLLGIVLCFDHRLKKSHRAIIGFIWMTILSVCIALPVRFWQFKPVNYDINPGDNRALNERYSTLFCQSLTVTKHRVFINSTQLAPDSEEGRLQNRTNSDDMHTMLYLLTNSTLNKTLTWNNFTMTTSILDRHYTYWRFYLNSGSRLILNYAIDNIKVERRFFVIRGQDSFDKWTKNGKCDISSCYDTYYLPRIGTYNKDITTTDTYFFIFEIVPIYISPFPYETQIITDFKVGQTTYNYEANNRQCDLDTSFSTQLKRAPFVQDTIKSSKCRFNLGFNTREFVFVRSPLFTDTREIYTRFVDEVKTECEPRIVAYVLICVCVPVVFILIYMIFVTVLCSLQKSVIQSHENWENAHDYRSPTERNFPSDRNFPSGERQPLIQEAPPSYSESARVVSPTSVPQEPPPPYTQI